MAPDLSVSGPLGAYSLHFWSLVPHPGVPALPLQLSAPHQEICGDLEPPVVREGLGFLPLKRLPSSWLWAGAPRYGLVNLGQRWGLSRPHLCQPGTAPEAEGVVSFYFGPLGFKHFSCKAGV